MIFRSKKHNFILPILNKNHSIRQRADVYNPSYTLRKTCEQANIHVVTKTDDYTVETSSLDIGPAGLK
jgi:hypothetical protein